MAQRGAACDPGDQQQPQSSDVKVTDADADGGAQQEPPPSLPPLLAAKPQQTLEARLAQTVSLQKQLLTQKDTIIADLKKQLQERGSTPAPGYSQSGCTTGTTTDSINVDEELKRERAENEILKKKIRELSGYARDIISIRAYGDRWAGEERDLKQTKKLLEEEVRCANDRIATLEQKCQEHASREQEATTLITTLTQRVQTLENDTINASGCVQKLSKETERIRAERDTLLSRVKRAEAERDQYEEQLHDQADKAEACGNHVSLLRGTLLETRNRLTKTENECVRLRCELHAAQSKRDELMLRCRELCEANQTARRKIADAAAALSCAPCSPCSRPNSPLRDTTKTPSATRRESRMSQLSNETAADGLRVQTPLVKHLRMVQHQDEQDFDQAQDQAEQQAFLPQTQQQQQQSRLALLMAQPHTYETLQNIENSSKEGEEMCNVGQTDNTEPLQMSNNQNSPNTGLNTTGNEGDYTHNSLEVSVGNDPSGAPGIDLSINSPNSKTFPTSINSDSSLIDTTITPTEINSLNTSTNTPTNILLHPTPTLDSTGLLTQLCSVEHSDSPTKSFGNTNESVNKSQDNTPAETTGMEGDTTTEEPKVQQPKKRSRVQRKKFTSPQNQKRPRNSSNNSTL